MDKENYRESKARQKLCASCVWKKERFSKKIICSQPICVYQMVEQIKDGYRFQNRLDKTERQIIMGKKRYDK